MRYLTIQRNKSFVACLMRLKIYIEDPVSNEIKIQGVQCRKIGEIKNGEQQTFMIGDERLRIYVIADKLSKNYCSDFYEVPAGTENVFISGSCKYNPLNGNAFRFDGIPSEEMKYRRKNSTKKGIWIFIISIIIGIVIGVASALIPIFDAPAEKEFTTGEFSITLNDSFFEESQDSYEAVYTSNDIAVFALKETFADYEELTDLTVDEYMDAVIKVNGADAEVKHKDGLAYYEYDGVSDQNYKFHYVAFSYKADDGFWLIQFAVSEDMFSEYEDSVFTYAKSVSVE